MKNKFNLKYIIKKIKTNRAEITINIVILIIISVVLVALFMGVVIGNSKDTINKAGNMINSITSTINNDNQELINECNKIQQEIIELSDDLDNCNKTYHTGSCSGSLCRERSCIIDGKNTTWRYTDTDLRDKINEQISQLGKQKNSLGCPL